MGGRPSTLADADRRISAATPLTEPISVELSDVDSRRNAGINSFTSQDATVLEEGFRNSITIAPNWQPPRQRMRARFCDFVFWLSAVWRKACSHGCLLFLMKNLRAVALATNPISDIWLLVSLFRMGHHWWFGFCAFFKALTAFVIVWLLNNPCDYAKRRARQDAFREAFGGKPHLLRLIFTDFSVFFRTLFSCATPEQAAYVKIRLAVEGIVEGFPWTLFQVYIAIRQKALGDTVVDPKALAVSLPQSIYTVYCAWAYVTTFAELAHEGNRKRFWDSLLTLGKGMPPPALLESILAERDVVIRADLSGLPKSGMMALARVVAMSDTLHTLRFEGTKVERSGVKDDWGPFCQELFSSRSLQVVEFTPATGFDKKSWCFLCALRLKVVDGGVELHTFHVPGDKDLFNAIERDNVVEVRQEVMRVLEPDTTGSKVCEGVLTGAQWAAKVGHWRSLRTILNAVPMDQTAGEEIAYEAAAEGQLACVQLMMAAGVSDWTESLDVACSFGRNHIVMEILKSSKANTKLDSFELATVAFHDRADLAKMLLEARANVNPALDAGQVAPLALCATYAAVKCVRVMLAARADLEASGDEQTPLGRAVKAGNLETARLLIDARANLQGRGGVIAVPLASAVHKKMVDMVRLLLTSRATIANDALGAKTLQTAIQDKRPDILGLLLSAQPEIAQGAESGRLLRAAVKGGVIDSLELLVKAKADVTAVRWPSTGAAFSPNLLLTAVESRSADVLKWLLKARASVQAPLGNAALVCAAELGSADLFRPLLEAGVSLEAEGVGDVALKAAALAGSAEITRLLLHQASARPKDVQAALAATVASGDFPEVVTLLLTTRTVMANAAAAGGAAAGTPAAAEGAAAAELALLLRSAAQNGGAAVAKLLLEARAQPAAAALGGVKELLNIALAANHGKVVKFFLTVQEDGTVTDAKLDALLTEAVATGAENSVQTLLEARSILVGATGILLLRSAVERGHTAVVRVLCESSIGTVSPDAPLDSGVMPLVAAMSAGHAAVTRQLLASRATLEVDWPPGNSVLLAAVRLGKADMVRLLLLEGAQVDTASLECAKERADKAILDLLEDPPEPLARSDSGLKSSASPTSTFGLGSMFRPRATTASDSAVPNPRSPALPSQSCAESNRSRF